MSITVLAANFVAADQLEAVHPQYKGLVVVHCFEQHTLSMFPVTEQCWLASDLVF